MKNKLQYIIIALAIAVTITYSISTVILFRSNMPNWEKYSLISFSSLFVITLVMAIVIGSIVIKRRRETIKRAFDTYVEESVSKSGVGLIIFNDNSDIIWVSKFIEDRLSRKIIGKKLVSISKDFEEKFVDGQQAFKFMLEGIVFNTQINFESNTIVLKDITNEDMVMNQYMSEKDVAAELEIDNYQQFQSMLPEEELFKVQSAVIKMLDDLVEKHNLIYRQYVNGKFLIFTNQAVLNEFMDSRFNFFDKIRSVEVIDGIKLSASMGVGSGTSQIKELIDLAKDGLMQALARGGDQVAVMETAKKPAYFGSKTEVVKTSSRVKIKQVSKLFEEKLKTKRIKKVVIYGHLFADLDAVGAALGVAEVAKAFGKEVYIQNNTFDSTTTKAMSDILTKEEKEIFIKKSKANKLTNKTDTLVVIVDTAEMTRIENESALDVVDLDNVFIFDHHRVSKLPENISTTNTYIDTTASSASEIITEVMQFITKSIKPSKNTAQMLLNGIYLDTKQFTKSTSSRTFAAASWLERFSANAALSSDILKLPEEHSKIIADIISRVREVKKGYFLSTYKGEVPQDIISLAADEILRVQGRKAAFVIAKMPGKQEFKMSARGNETNVQVIAEAVGGGGHFGAAAAVSKEPIVVFEDNIVQSIVSIKGDK